MTINIRVRINPTIADYYGNTTDIPNMPDFPGIWIIDQQTYDFWLGIMEQDLQRELDPQVHGGEPYWTAITMYRRQIATLKNHTRTDAPIAKPAKREAALAKRELSYQIGLLHWDAADLKQEGKTAEAEALYAQARILISQLERA
jgi:hypothetical protein